MWDPAQYLKFAEERARPFHDLLAQVRPDNVRAVMDLGCGPGELTRWLADRLPEATVTGVDSAPEMLERARALAIPGRLCFVQGDIASWLPMRPVDLVVSNAALQWVLGHEALLPRLAHLVGPGGTLAVQVPDHMETPAQKAVDEVTLDSRWREALAGVGLQPGCVKPLAWYVEHLLDLGFEVNAWATAYVHVLEGDDPVLQWMMGTALRPLLARLGPDEQEEFLGEVGGRLRAAYPSRAGLTLFPFPRLFFVATRPTDSPGLA